MSSLNLGMPSTTNPHLFRTRESTLEKILMSVVNVKKSMAANSDVLQQKNHTGERPCEGSKFSTITLASVNTREFTLRQVLVWAANVENYLAKAPALLYTREFTLEKGLMNSVSVGNLLDRALASLIIGELIQLIHL